MNTVTRVANFRSPKKPQLLIPSTQFSLLLKAKAADATTFHFIRSPREDGRYLP